MPISDNIHELRRLKVLPLLVKRIENELLAITKFDPHDQNNRFVKLTVQDIIKNADESKVLLLESQSGFKKRYYYFKQIKFNGANLLNVNKMLQVLLCK